MEGLMELGVEDLKKLTDDFREENFICHSRYCKLFRGRFPAPGWQGIEEGRENEINFLGKYCCEMSCRSNFPKLMGWCRDDEARQLGVVYDFKSLDVLCSLVIHGKRCEASDIYAFGVLLLELFCKRVLDDLDHPNDPVRKSRQARVLQEYREHISKSQHKHNFSSLNESVKET